MSIPAPRASIAIIVGTIESFPHLTEMNIEPRTYDLMRWEPSDKLCQHCVVIGVVHVHLLQRLRHLPVPVVEFNQIRVVNVLSIRNMNKGEDKGIVRSIKIFCGQILCVLVSVMNVMFSCLLVISSDVIICFITFFQPGSHRQALWKEHYQPYVKLLHYSI